nr:unnamed protein product [Callosobruchus analis]
MFYGLTNSIQGITADNTNSNFKFINELKKNLTSILKINLCARDSEFEESDNMLSEDSQIDDDEINEEVQPQSSVQKIRNVAKK